MEQNLMKPGPKAPHSANWKPGQSGNENGRPVGVRNAFSTAFLTDLRDREVSRHRNDRSVRPVSECSDERTVVFSRYGQAVDFYSRIV